MESGSRLANVRSDFLASTTRVGLWGGQAPRKSGEGAADMDNDGNDDSHGHTFLGHDQPTIAAACRLQPVSNLLDPVTTNVPVAPLLSIELSGDSTETVTLAASWLNTPAPARATTGTCFAHPSSEG